MLTIILLTGSESAAASPFAGKSFQQQGWLIDTPSLRDKQNGSHLENRFLLSRDN